MRKVYTYFFLFALFISSTAYGQVKNSNALFHIYGDAVVKCQDFYIHGEVVKTGETDFYFPLGNDDGGFPLNMLNNPDQNSIKVSFNGFDSVPSSSEAEVLSSGYWKIDNYNHQILDWEFEWKQDLNFSELGLVLLHFNGSVWKKVQGVTIEGDQLNGKFIVKNKILDGKYAIGAVLAIESIKITPDCNEDNGSLLAKAKNGTPPYTYQWTNGGTQNQINYITSGVFGVTVTDANGKVASDFIKLLSFPLWDEMEELEEDDENKQFTSLNTEEWGSFALSNALLEEGVNGLISQMFNHSTPEFSVSLNANQDLQGVLSEYKFIHGLNGEYNVHLNGIQQTLINTPLLKSENNEIQIEKLGNQILFKLNEVLIYQCSQFVQNEELHGSLSIRLNNKTVPYPSISFCHDPLSISTKQYFRLSHKMGNVIWRLNGNQLNFFYEEQYNVEDGSNLQVYLYDNESNRISLNVKINSGNNWIEIPCISNSVEAGGKNYNLKVINGKGEESYLQFITPMTFNACN